MAKKCKYSLYEESFLDNQKDSLKSICEKPKKMLKI